MDNKTAVAARCAHRTESDPAHATAEVRVMTQPKHPPKDWRRELPRLTPLALPLLPCGAGQEKKGPIDPSTGYGLTGWQDAAFSVPEILAMNGKVRSVGSRTGSGLLALDIDGATGLELCLAHDCDPQQAHTWQVHRDTDPCRLKVLWRLTPEQQQELGELKTKAFTKEPTRNDAGEVIDKGEAVELFHQGGSQVLLLGQHVPSGGRYLWPDGHGPEALAPIPPAWWALTLAIAAGELGIKPQSANKASPRSSSSKSSAGWRSADPCPICRRDTTGYCSRNTSSGTIRCFYGSTFSPEITHGRLTLGQTVGGTDGIRYGFAGAEPQANGDVFGTFVIDKPRPRLSDQPEPRPESERQQAARQEEQQQEPPASQAKRRKPRRLSHAQAMKCLETCIEVQAVKERNTMRRRARLRKVAADLGVSKYVKDSEIAQRVLEAKDKQAGRCFRPITAAERMAMERPRVEWLIPGLLPAGDLTILGGRPKVGKTRLAVRIVAAVLNGGAVLDCEPASPRRVILVTDDQGDGDTADGLSELGIWEHPGLLWSGNFRLTEADTDALLATIEANPGALVVIDSLRSVSRSLQFGENDPELGAALYDLKDATIEAGGTMLLVHHCNKAEGLVGIEALSGHSSIAGAANTVLTLHHLPDDKGRPLKSEPMRRLVRDPRSGQGFDLVISPTAGTNDWHRAGNFDDWQRSKQEAGEEEKRIGRMPDSQKRAMRVLHDSGEWLTRRQVCEALGIGWGDRGRGTDAQRVGDALKRLAQLGMALSKSAGREAVYRTAAATSEDGPEPSHSAQLTKTTLTTLTSSQAKGSQCQGETLTTMTSPDTPADTGALSGLSGSGPDSETDCGDRLSGLSGLSGPVAPMATPPPALALLGDPPLPQVLDKLAELRREKPTAPAAALAIALQVAGMGTYDGRKVRQWMDWQDRQSAA